MGRGGSLKFITYVDSCTSSPNKFHETAARHTNNYCVHIIHIRTTLSDAWGDDGERNPSSTLFFVFCCCVKRVSYFPRSTTFSSDCISLCRVTNNSKNKNSLGRMFIVLKLKNKNNIEKIIVIDGKIQHNDG